MSALLERLLGRLPIGWLQLSYNPARFAAAIAGVAFANILVFMQLGFLGALTGSILYPYQALSGDILISASDMNTLADGAPLPRQRMFQALSVDGVVRATPIYYGRIDWMQPNGTVRTLDLFGIDPQTTTFKVPGIENRRDALMLDSMALLDSKTRNAPKDLFPAIQRGETYKFEVKGRTLTVAGLFEIGGGFSSDGYLVVSDQTFLKLFPQRAPGAPNHILVSVSPQVSAASVVERLRQILPAYDTRVNTLSDAAGWDQRYQTTQRPVGLVLGFGMVIGVLVGIVIVYQVLSTDVADHLKEYATFKAIGYARWFFLSVVFEEAIILALCGFLPGLSLSLGLYAIVARVTGLPLSMTLARALGVLSGTIAMCALSGAFATRKLERADPADLF